MSCTSTSFQIIDNAAKRVNLCSFRERLRKTAERYWEDGKLDTIRPYFYDVNITFIYFIFCQKDSLLQKYN